MPLTNYGENKLLDWLYRGQSFTPGTGYWALLTAASDSSYTEQTGGGVTRQSAAASLAAWSGTQGDGTTAASSGTSGEISNNAAITFAASASAEISASYVGRFDASSGGNLIEYHPLVDGNGDPITRTWFASDPVRIPIAQLRLRLD